MKIWIIDNSIHGNGIIAAKTIAAAFPESEVTITHNRDRTPKKLAQEKVDLLIIGTAVRKPVLVWETQRWIKKVGKELKKRNHAIAYVVGFVAHMRNGEKIHNKGLSGITTRHR